MSRKAIFDVVRQARGGKPWQAEDIAILDKALDQLGVARGDDAAVRSLHDDAAFFESIRKSGLFVGGLKQEQVDGMKALLAACGAAGWPMTFTAYALATAYHETAHQMQPVREAFWLDDAWRKRNLHYYPYYGRGYVQLTWQKNYERADEALSLGGRLTANLDVAMDPDVAAQIMVRGMEEGWFTGHTLAETLPASGLASFAQFKASRPIINGHDRDADIANYALRFQAALLVGKWS